MKVSSNFAPPRPGKPGVLGERDIGELGMGVVDDVGCDLDRRLGGLPGRGGIAGQGKQDADLHRVGGAGEPHAGRELGGGCTRPRENGSTIELAS